MSAPARDVATKRAARIDELRHSDARRALVHLCDDELTEAIERMLMTVELQALLEGCGRIDLPRGLDERARSFELVKRDVLA